MKTKLMLLITLSALVVTASAQNINAGDGRDSARQPNAVRSISGETVKKAGSTTSGITGSAITKSASPVDSKSTAGPAAVKRVIDPSARSKKTTGMYRMVTPPSAIHGSPVTHK